MRAIDRKLLRDLWQVKGQGLAIAMVIAAGVAMFIMYLSTFESLRRTQETYYQRYRFADVFASLKRAPLMLEDRIAEIPGVAAVRTRVVAPVTIDVPELAEPVVGRLLSIPPRETITINGVAVLRGRWIDPARPDEVLVSEGFALARGLEPGSEVTVVLNGRRRALEVVGIALTPEYVYTIRPGALLPDDGQAAITGLLTDARLQRFAGTIAFGVVYNAARISLAERSRELASLRVIGFTRAEISFILLGELATVTLVAIPLGLLLGLGLAALVVLAYDTELYRLPLVVLARTYGFAALTVLTAAVVSGVVVRRRLDHLDLVEVLKTRE